MADPLGAGVTGDSPSVLVIGGGLAGLAAATALAPRGFRVTLLESRQRLGGRASSFTDPATGQMVDACQHVTMGCCTNFAHFCKSVGIGQFLEAQEKLYFFTPNGMRSVFKADPLPAPFHLGRALAGSHYLTPLDKLRVAWGMISMLRESPHADPPLLDWLRQHWQNDRTIDRFWATVLVSALNESVDRLGFKYARKVFVDGFLRSRAGYVVHVPTVPLGRLYGDELREWLASRNVDVRLNGAARSVNFEQGVVSHVELRDGSILTADQYILAAPFERVRDLLPDDIAAMPLFANIKHLEASPIASVHLWFNRPVMSLPHAVLVGCVGQWVFNRGETSPGEHYLQVVISAARLDRSKLPDVILAELKRLFPEVGRASLLRSKVVTEHTLTFSPVAGVDHWRPGQATPIRNLFLAGDWTATGWPATMEGAVRSGYLAAEAILDLCGRPESIVLPS